MGGPVLSPPSDASRLAGGGWGGEGSLLAGGQMQKADWAPGRDIATFPGQSTGQVEVSVRGSNGNPGSVRPGGGGWGGSVPLGREVLGLSWLCGLPGSGTWPPEGIGDMAAKSTLSSRCRHS